MHAICRYCSLVKHVTESTRLIIFTWSRETSLPQRLVHTVYWDLHAVLKMQCLLMQLVPHFSSKGFFFEGDFIFRCKWKHISAIWFDNLDQNEFFITFRDVIYHYMSLDTLKEESQFLNGNSDWNEVYS